MKIREISGDTAPSTDIAYVELQMTAAGQNLVAGHPLTVYDEDAIGGPAATFTIPNNVPLADNQRTILIGDTNVAGRDITWSALGGFIGIGNFGGAGALCFPDASPPDCVSWGTAFTGAALIPDGTIPFPAALPSSSALRRTISPGCPTLLESGDDTNNAAVDFSVVPRAPRSNATVPIEKECDNKGPTQTLKAKKKQDVDKAAVTERLDEAGTVTFKGKVKVPTASGGARLRTLDLVARAVKTKKSTKSLAANTKKRVKIKLSRRAKKKVKAAIEDAGPRKITVTATAKDTAGNRTTKKVRFKLTD